MQSRIYLRGRVAGSTPSWNFGKDVSMRCVLRAVKASKCVCPKPLAGFGCGREWGAWGKDPGMERGRERWTVTTIWNFMCCPSRVARAFSRRDIKIKSRSYCWELTRAVALRTRWHKFTYLPTYFTAWDVFVILSNGSSGSQVSGYRRHFSDEKVKAEWTTDSDRILEVCDW